MKCLWSGEFQEESPLSNPHEVCFHTGASQDCDTVDMPRLAKGGPHTHGRSPFPCVICQCPMRFAFAVMAFQNPAPRRPLGYLHQWVFWYFGWKFMMSPTFLAKNDPVLGSCKPEFLRGCRPSNPGGCISLPQKRLCSYLTVTQCLLCLLLNNSRLSFKGCTHPWV